MDEGLIQLLILVGAGLSWLWGRRQEAARKERQRRTRGQRPDRPETAAPSGTTAPAKRKSPLDELFENLQAELERASGTSGPPARTGPMGRRASRPLEGAEEVEELESLEEEPVVASMETEPDRPLREVVDYDESAERLVRARIRAAEVRNRALTKADHAAFDRRIRQAVPPVAPRSQSRGRGRAGAALRQAVIWREVLGPPVSERDLDIRP